MVQIDDLGIRTEVTDKVHHTTTLDDLAVERRQNIKTFWDSFICEEIQKGIFRPEISRLRLRENYDT